MKANVVMLLSTSFLLSACNSVSKSNNEPQPLTIQQECEQSGNENSPQCQIYNNKDWNQAEKEFQIGTMYMTGFQDIDSDCDKAKYWLDKSALVNNGDAFNSLGLFYMLGCKTQVDSIEGITIETSEIDYKKAEEYYLRAIKYNGKFAKSNLGTLYRIGGFGVQQDYDKAIKWYEESIETEPDRAYDGLSLVYFQQNKNQQALPYLIKGAELGNAHAQYNLAYTYESGSDGFEVDNNKAIEWYTKSAEQGFPSAQNNLRILKEKIANQP